MKTYLIHCWDLFANSRQIEIKARNTKKAEKHFYNLYPKWFITKIELVATTK